jgi:hypothetical protein
MHGEDAQALVPRTSHKAVDGDRVNSQLINLANLVTVFRNWNQVSNQKYSTTMQSFSEDDTRRFNIPPRTKGVNEGCPSGL